MKMEKYSSGIAKFFGGLLMGFGAMSLNDWAVLIGMACAVGTFALNWYYKDKEFKLKFNPKSGAENVTSAEE
ncbi:phage holin family protein [Yersinia enterocolitica]|uniref:phage holin family protein n=1 Tax=Yersinia enterocolitica TaxID=630 RepID=UPI0005E1C9EF|nr:phage holin family protein [Yersinia enterocolitica]EKN3779520.1 phage holin family protein [Yersinia enterocolitica]EKN4009761.1 phage holin family protein [Yersinia enterocolitica]EKN4832427.1 phage holin family protein [Yersinia enterocolitica]EKN4854199.1 phage holin family protein [Yersinia enterocolitica]ELI8371626.1 phage holin family protein [Yersinia enterocolitica]